MSNPFESPLETEMGPKILEQDEKAADELLVRIREAASNRDPEEKKWNRFDAGPDMEGYEAFLKEQAQRIAEELGVTTDAAAMESLLSAYEVEEEEDDEVNAAVFSTVRRFRVSGVLVGSSHSADEGGNHFEYDSYEMAKVLSMLRKDIENLPRT